MKEVISVMCVLILVRQCCGIVWNTVPNSRIDLKETIREVTRFIGQRDAQGPDYFKNILVDGDYMLVGAKNFVYNISLSTLEEKDQIQWKSSEIDKSICTSRKKTEEECHNYIRVIVRVSDTKVFICGTNAFKPYCRTYLKEPEGGYFVLNDQNGMGKCPFDPADNNTASYVQSVNRIFTATVADLTANDALIYGKPLTKGENDLPELRTEQFNSNFMSEPNFIDSFEYEDMVYFFFRETAVEATNCGKTVYSRVARVCTSDQGGQYLLQTSWTSFFKSRLNCSIPGNFPFYFNEIQSTSGIGKGNYMPAISFDNNTDMVYAVFNTPQNSIHGSAVCAFRFADIKKTFEGAFKHQEKPHSNWLPVPEADTPQTHPAKSCYNGTQDNDKTLTFIKAHPLMDKAVPAYGGQPLLIHSDPSYRLTIIAVDWQVASADLKLYDVLFVGTDDGRVLKCINKGEPQAIETVIIEEIQVFENKAPVVNLQVHRDQGRLIVVSKHEIKSILLQRCHLQTSCSGCIALQDPYCAWKDGVCRKSSSGIQSIQTGKHSRCTDNPTSTNKVPEVPSTQASTCPPCPVCTQRTPNTEDNLLPFIPKSTERRQTQTPTTMRNDIPVVADASTGEESRMRTLKYAAYEMAVAVFFSVILSLVVGFAVGYLVFGKGYHRRWTKRQDAEEPCNSKLDEEKNHRLQKIQAEKADNRYENPRVQQQNHTNFNHLAVLQPPLQNIPNHQQQNSLSSLPDNRGAQLNVVLNDINCKSSPGKSLNENIETSTSPNHKLKKQVYL